MSAAAKKARRGARSSAAAASGAARPIGPADALVTASGGRARRRRGARAGRSVAAGRWCSAAAAGRPPRRVSAGSAANRSRVARPCASCCWPATADVREVLVAADQDDVDVLQDIVDLALDVKVPRARGQPQPTVRRGPHRVAPGRDRPCRPAATRTTSTTLARPSRRRRSAVPPRCVDGVTDPGNLGALLRSAECAGVTGVILPRHRAAHVTPTVTKAAAGAIEHLPMAVVGGLPDRPASAARRRGAGDRSRRGRRHRRSSTSTSPARSRSAWCSAPRARACRAWCASAATPSSASRCSGSWPRSTWRPPARWPATRSPAAASRRRA